jgi:hypothetical protein
MFCSRRLEGISNIWSTSQIDFAVDITKAAVEDGLGQKLQTISKFKEKARKFHFSSDKFQRYLAKLRGGNPRNFKYLVVWIFQGSEALLRKRFGSASRASASKLYWKRSQFYWRASKRKRERFRILNQSASASDAILKISNQNSQNCYKYLFRSFENHELSLQSGSKISEKFWDSLKTYLND